MQPHHTNALGIAAISFATLVHQLLLVRFVSARLLNNYAFLIVSLSMAGFAIGGLILAVTLRRSQANGTQESAIPPSGEGDSNQRTARGLVPPLFDLYVIAVILVWASFGRVELPLTPGGAPDEYEFALSVSLALLLCVPFILSGLSVGLFLSSDERTGRLYAFDLIAAALGCVVSIATVSFFGLERLVALTCVVLVVVRFVMARPATWATRGTAGSAVGLALIGSLWPVQVLHVEPIEGSMLSRVVKLGGHVVETRWDPAARIEVAEAPLGVIPSMFAGWPALTGNDPALLAQYRSFLTQNNFAFTLMVDAEGPASSFTGVKDTIYSAGYVALAPRNQTPKAIAIGVGGGFDLLTGMANGASEMTGVEINAATLSILEDRYRDKPDHFLRDPRVKLVHADGRHFIARSKEKYDVIQLSGVDSYSGAQGSAHVFSETYLYTLEAMMAYIEHLSDDGVLNVMRLEHPAAREMLRVVSTLVAALRQLGYENPAAHIQCVGQSDGSFVAALVSKTPFTPAEVEHLRAWTERVSFLTFMADPFSEGPPTSNHEIFLRRARFHEETTTYEKYPYIVWPATDDWPFFFQFSRFDHLPRWWSGDSTIARPTLPIALFSLGVLLTMLMLFTVILPLWVIARRGLRVDRPMLHVVYFALLGLGFLIVEVHLMQRLALLLGGQTMSVTVVLMTLLLASGLGSASMSRVFTLFRGPRAVAYALAGVALVLPLLDSALYDAVAYSLPLRIVIAMALTAPLGFLMGVWFPLGLDHLKATSSAFVPWAWGVNGAFSVLAPVITIACAVTFGQTLSYLLAIPLYLGAGVIADRLGMWRVRPVELSGER